VTESSPSDSPAPAPWRVRLADPAATAALGALLAPLATPGDVVFLRGPLGAGKTSLARGLIHAWTSGVEEDAPSPTFTLVQTYESERGPLWHMDLYRLAAPEEALELGLEDALEDAVLLIEWPERLGALTPPARLDIELACFPRRWRIALRRPGMPLEARPQPDRPEALEALIARTGFAAAQRLPMSGDASTRRYTRLILPDRRAILMDAPRSAESEPCPPQADDAARLGMGWNAISRLAASRVEAFAAVAGHLSGIGLSTPDISSKTWATPCSPR
jgi:N-acetylmuramate 1-kinase